jgi:hypothetical protein
MRLNGRANRHANIEDTLLAASLEGLAGDGRVLSLLVDWLEIHHSRINADRLVQMVRTLSKKESEKFKAFWAAMAQWLNDNRFAKLKRLAPKHRFNFLEDRTSFLIEKNGEDERFKETCVRIPQNVLRHRLEDILEPQELARVHHAYRFRIFMGPNYKADMWALLQQEPELSAAELARQGYGSYPTAFLVKRDFMLLKGKAVAQFS